MTTDPNSSKRRSAAAPGGQRPQARPSHPGLAATILMIGIVVVLVLVAALPLLG